MISAEDQTVDCRSCYYDEDGALIECASCHWDGAYDAAKTDQERTAILSVVSF